MKYNIGYDTIEYIGKSLIQHGPGSSRIYLMKLHADDIPHIIEQLDSLAALKNYGKVFVKIRKRHQPVFKKAGYIQEAYVPGFFKGKEGGYFLGKYFSVERKTIADKKSIKNIIRMAESKARPGILACSENTINVHRADQKDSEPLSDFYRQIFTSYPFPIFDKQYIEKTMAENVEYYLVRQKKRIIAAGSCEVDKENLNAEMTDFATLPEFRGHGLAQQILSFMENAMGVYRVFCLYTIARALSSGINITFSKKGYKFAGTLFNNTHIAGSIESMNVWYRHL
jgi:beta-lysine N6-acetyltransferase